MKLGRNTARAEILPILAATMLRFSARMNWAVALGGAKIIGPLPMPPPTSVLSPMPMAIRPSRSRA
jgi:hypothetical protein